MVKEGPSPSPAAKKTTLQWSSTRTFFLRPVDPALKVQQLNRFEFGQMPAWVIPNTENPQRMSVEQLVRTTTGDWKVQIARGAISLMRSSSEVAVGQFRKWNIESATHMQSASVVMMGVPLAITDEQLNQGVIEGLRPEPAPEAQVRLEQIACKRLLRQRSVPQPPRGDGPNEAAAMWVPSRAVQIFMPNDIRDYVLQKGYFQFHFLVHGVRPYEPPTFFYNHCKRIGAHSTTFHRFSTVDGSNGGGAGPTTQP